MITTPEELEAYLEPLHIRSGIGTKEGESCSLGYINLSLRQPFSDKAPPSMSDVARNAIVILNDAVPDEIRNSLRWKRAIAHAAFTGREHEPERAKIALNWMWETVLPQLQPVADAHGFGAQWREMCEKKTVEAAAETWKARAAERAEDAAWAAERAAWSEAAWSAARAAWYASEAVEESKVFWLVVDPCGLIERMNAVS